MSDQLGERIVRERTEIARKRSEADMHERMSRQLRREADEQERLLGIARFSLNQVPTLTISEIDPRGTRTLGKP